MENFSTEERHVLARHFSNLDGQVFVLTDLPEVVKAALFARYSRSPKSLRRLFLDEFRGSIASDSGPAQAVGLNRAEELFERVFVEYGDDSVAQLAGVHVAVESASNILTKILERGRLMSYLEQSTRYVPYNDKPDGRWRYHVPEELTGAPRSSFVAAADQAFELYAGLFDPLQGHLRRQHPKPAASSESAYRMSIRAKACDILRGLLPAATASNVGIYGSAQAYEALLLRLLSHELQEARTVGQAMLAELKKIVPVFMQRVERPDRGEVFLEYLRTTRENMRSLVRNTLAGAQREQGPSVVLTDFDPEGETKVVAAAFYEFSDIADVEAMEIARGLTPAQRADIIAAYSGDRSNRRHKPGRAFERTSYRFDIVADYGVFRDLQRHRLLTIEWQSLNPHLGFDLPPEIVEIGAERPWSELMQRCRGVYEELRSTTSESVAQYVVPMAYRIRFCMEMNAREALHLIELRTTDQGHRNYRAVCLAMHDLIAEQAGHRAIAAAMRFVKGGEAGLERLRAEERIEAKRSALAARQTG